MNKENTSMKISTVMATYNGAQYIKLQLESILTQSRKVDEVIIIDDCSNDDTVKIIRDFICDKKLEMSWHLFENAENLGYKENFKKTFQKSTGDLIILCDQDDVWEVSKVENIENVYVNTGALAINTAFRFIDQNGTLINERENNNNNNLLKKNYLPNEVAQIPFTTILETNISPGCTMAISKELKDIFLEITEGLLPHDWELNIIAALHGGLYFYNKKLTKYRIHGNNVIGLETNLNRFKLSTSVTYERRCKNLSERLELKKFIEILLENKMIDKSTYNVFKKLHIYDMFRYKCVVEKKWYMWFFMPIYAIIIRKYHYVRFRGMIGDLIFSIR